MFSSAFLIATCTSVSVCAVVLLFAACIATFFPDCFPQALLPGADDRLLKDEEAFRKLVRAVILPFSWLRCMWQNHAVACVQLDAVRNTESVTPAGASAGTGGFDKFMTGAGAVSNKSESPLESEDDDVDDDDDDDDVDDDEFGGQVLGSPHSEDDLNFDEIEADAVRFVVSLLAPCTLAMNCKAPFLAIARPCGDSACLCSRDRSLCRMTAFSQRAPT